MISLVVSLLTNFVCAHSGIRATREEVASLFQKLASNRRVITYDEFLNGMQWLNKVSCAISLGEWRCLGHNTQQF